MKENCQIIDLACGIKAMYIQKNHPLVLYNDIRREEKGFFDFRPNFEVQPDIQEDFTKLPFEDHTFYHVVFDPPHLWYNPNMRMTKPYGYLEKHNYQEVLKKGFEEGWRILKPGGTLVFKWNETSISKKEVLSLFPIDPIYGHPTGSKNKTHWLIFFKEVKE